MVGPKVAIVILNWNGYELTRNCLLSLRNISFESYKIILVDNGSSDNSLIKLKEEFREVIYLSNKENLGFTGGNNVGVRYALEKEFDHILLLNNDTIVERGFLNPLVNFLESNSDYAAVQPKICYEGKRNIIWNAGGGFFKPLNMTWSIGAGKEDLGQFDKEFDTEWITGCAFMVKASYLNMVGLFDESYFAYYEDVDWSFRLKKAGGKLRYLPKSKIFHVVSASSKKKKGKEGVISPLVHYLRIRNHLFLTRSHSGNIAFAFSLIYQTVKMITFIGIMLVRGRFTKAKAILRGFMEGILNQRN